MIQVINIHEVSVSKLAVSADLSPFRTQDFSPQEVSYVQVRTNRRDKPLHPPIFFYRQDTENYLAFTFFHAMGKSI